jgi:hypothetical protein
MLDWKSRLLPATSAPGQTVGKAAVTEALAKGADPKELQALVQAQPDRFDAEARSLVDAGAFLPGVGAKVTGQRAHLVQLAPHAALPWWQQQKLTIPPSGLVIDGPAQEVKVGPERFTPQELSALLSSVA